jgi:N-dimethylarginine dimethylaminohydrolase
VNHLHAPSMFLVSAPYCLSPCAARGRYGTHGECSFRVVWCADPDGRLDSVESARAARQHGAFVRQLRDQDAEIVRLPFVHGVHDSVFVKDVAVVVRRGDRTLALPTRLRSTRDGEQRARAQVLESFGVELQAAPEEAMEGSDVVVGPDFGEVFLGHGLRSSPSSAGALEALLEAPAVPVALRDPDLLHLDMVLAVLRDGTHFVCEEALTARAVASVRRAARGRDIVSVPMADARHFALHFVELDGVVVTSARSPTVNTALHQRGIRVVETPLTQFHRAGGSAARLVSRVHVDTRAARQSTAA